MENNDFVLKRLQELEEHFNTISNEEFEENLISAGYGEIKSSEESYMELLSEDMLESTIVYKNQKRAYSYSVNSASYFNVNNIAAYAEVS